MPIVTMFIMLVLLCVAALLAAVWLVSLVFFLKGRKKGSRSQMWIAGVPLVLLSGLGLWLAYLTLAPPNPTYAYKDAFGAPPSNDVTEMRSSDDTFGDYSVIHLKFKASPTTIQRLTAKGFGKGFTGKDLMGENSNWDAQGIYYHDEDTPEWWRPERTATTKVFYATKRLGHFNSLEDETLIYDSNTNQAYYYYHGID